MRANFVRLSFPFCLSGLDVSRRYLENLVVTLARFLCYFDGIQFNDREQNGPFEETDLRICRDVNHPKRRVAACAGGGAKHPYRAHKKEQPHRKIRGVVTVTSMPVGSSDGDLERSMSNSGPVSFDLATVSYLREVLEDAWDCLSHKEQAATTKSYLGQRILKAAAAGERSRRRLIIAALDVEQARDARHPH